MAIPLILLSVVGRILPITIRAGSALATFVAKNPMISGGVVSITAIINALNTKETTEQKKLEILKDIETANPAAHQEILKKLIEKSNFLGIDTHNLGLYLLILCIIYLYLYRGK